MQDLEKMIEELLETSRKLPPGPERQDALKEVGPPGPVGRHFEEVKIPLRKITDPNYRSP